MKYEKGNYLAIVEPNPQGPSIDLYVKNTKFNLGFHLNKDSLVGVDNYITTYTNIFGSTSETSTHKNYDDKKTMQELFDLGKLMVDFMDMCDSKIADDEKQKAMNIFNNIHIEFKENLL